jgi:carboxyl-terminal processing protease
MTQWSGFSLTDVDFENFIGFLKTNDFQYQTETEKELAKAISHADEDNLSASIASSYKELMNSIDTAKQDALFSKKTEIMSLLSDEILKRYFYRSGLYDYQIINNAEILEAVSILQNNKRYRKILK